MALEIGAKVTGKVTGITNFGAFVDLGEGKSGLVHISEISDGYVKDIHDVLSLGDEVTVVVVSIKDGKIGLSIRKAQPHPAGAAPSHQSHAPAQHHATSRPAPRRDSHASNRHDTPDKGDFDSLMSGFLKESEDRLSSLRKNTEGKRGGRGGRRN